MMNTDKTLNFENFFSEKLDHLDQLGQSADDVISKIEYSFEILYELKRPLQSAINSNEGLVNLFEEILLNRVDQYRIDYIQTILNLSAGYKTAHEQFVIWDHQTRIIPSLLKPSIETAKHLVDKIDKIKSFWLTYANARKVDIEFRDIPLESLSVKSIIEPENEQSGSPIELTEIFNTRIVDLELGAVPLESLNFGSNIAPENEMSKLSKETDIHYAPRLAILFFYLFQEYKIPFTKVGLAELISKISGLGSENIRKLLSSPLKKLVDRNIENDLIAVCAALKDIGITLTTKELRKKMPTPIDKDF